MSFGLYLGGFLVLIVGLGIAAHMMHVPPNWIAVGATVMAGIGIISAVSNTRKRDE